MNWIVTWFEAGSRHTSFYKVEKLARKDFEYLKRFRRLHKTIKQIYIAKIIK
jgi:hypothetical protein